MRRRDFLRAMVGGSVAAVLGVQARQVDGEVVKVARSSWTQRTNTLTMTSADGQSFSIRQTGRWPEEMG